MQNINKITNFVFGQGQLFPRHKKKKKRYAHLISRERRKFKTLHKDSIVVITYIAWAAILYSCI